MRKKQTHNASIWYTNLGSHFFETAMVFGPFDIKLENAFFFRLDSIINKTTLSDL